MEHINEQAEEEEQEREIVMDKGEEITTETESKEEEGLLIFIEEQQKGTMTYDYKDEEYRTSGIIKIVNKTGSPIFDLTLALSGVDKTSLKGRAELDIGVLRHEEGKNIEEIVYSASEIPKAVVVMEELGLPSDLPRPVGYLNEKIDITLGYTFANKWNVPFSVSLEKELPRQFEILETPTLEKGSLVKKEDRLTIENVKLEVGDRFDVTVKARIAPSTPDAFKSGIIKYAYEGTETTITGLDIKEVRGSLKINSYIDKSERTVERGVWECYVVVDNTTKAEIKVSPEIAIVTGKLVEDYQPAEYRWNIVRRHPGMRSYDTMVFEPVLVKPGESKRIGPFLIKSDEEPKLDLQIKTWIIPIVKKVLRGEFLIKDREVPVFAAKVGKSLRVSHPDYIHGLTESQVAAHLEETIDVESFIENTGSAPVDFVRIKEIIPEHFIPPKRVNVRVYLSKAGSEFIMPSETLDINLEPDDTDPSHPHNVVVDVKDVYTRLGEFISNGDKIIVRYQITSSKLTESGRVYEFPSHYEMALAPGTKPYQTDLSDVPRIEVVEALRKVVKSKDIILGEERDTYTVVILLKNEGDLPVKSYEFVDKIPLTFELVEEKINPEPRDIAETKDGFILKWFIPEIPPKSEFKITYQVVGRPGHRASDLYRIYEGE